MASKNEQNQMISTYVDHINALFDLVEDEANARISPENGERQSIPVMPAKTRLGSSSAPAVNNYGGASNVQRAEAPTPTKCFLWGGYDWNPCYHCRGHSRSDGGKTTVNILNAVGTMTANIINSATAAVSVVLPPITNTVGNIIVNWIDPHAKKPQPSPPSPAGEWVKYPNGQMVWVPAGQKPPANPTVNPPPNPQGEWVREPNGQMVWVPAGQKPPKNPTVNPPPTPQGEWVTYPNGQMVWVPAGQKPPQNPTVNPPPNPQGQWVTYPNGQMVWVPAGQYAQPPGPASSNSPSPTRSAMPDAIRERSLAANSWVPSAAKSIGQRIINWLYPHENKPQPPSAGEWVRFPNGQLVFVPPAKDPSENPSKKPTKNHQSPSKGEWVTYPNGEMVWVPAGLYAPDKLPQLPSSPTNQSSGPASASYSPSPTRSVMPNAIRENSLESCPTIQESQSDIHKTLLGMNACVDGMLSKLD